MNEDKKKYETFEEFYEKTYRLVYLFVRDYTKDWYIAEEIIAIVWAKIAEQPEKFLNQETRLVQNYIRVMVKNQVCEQYRIQERQNRSIEKAAELLIPDKMVEEEILLKDSLERLDIARGQLSAEDNQLLNLRFDQELSVKETGKIMGLKQSTVKMRQCRVLMKLRKMLD